MISQEFQSNRARFPTADLVKFRGSWVAFSPDGTRIIASRESIESLEEHLVALGVDGRHVVLERVPGNEDDCVVGGDLT